MRFLSIIKIPSYGRILFPKDIRELYELESIKVELFFKDQAIHIRKLTEESTTGHVRAINSQGRLSIPTLFRKKIDWENRNYLELYYVTPDYFILREDQQGCTFCTNTDANLMVSAYGKYICDDCLQVILGKRFMIISEMKVTGSAG